MRRRLWGALVVACLLVATIPNLAWGETRGAAAEPRQAVEAQVVINGSVVGSFTEVSGLDIRVEQVAAVCRADGKDDDCDGIAWAAETLRAMWRVAAAADELEDNSWLTTRARHDIAMNAIRNIKAIVRQVETTLTDPAANLKTRHDTAKNAIGNVRMVVTVLTETTANEAGVDQAALGRLAEAIRTLEAVDSGWVVRKRPGRTTYGNITLSGAHGSSSSLVEWYQKVLDGTVERKSGSIILLDRSGAEVVRYNFYEAWPCSYDAALGTEHMELAVEKIERVIK